MSTLAKLILLFTIVPLVELWLLLAIGDAIGFFPTVALTIVTAFLGAFLAKREGRRVLGEYKRAIAEMRAPDEGVLSGVLVLVGAITLVTPGILTDITGLLLLFPPTRKLIAGVIRKRYEHGLEGRAGEADQTGGFSFRVVDFAAGRWGDETETAAVSRPRLDPSTGVIDVPGEDVTDVTTESSTGPHRDPT